LRLAGYELTVSTSLSAGQRVMLPAGTPHVCYDGSLRDFTGGPESQGISTFVAASRRLAERLQQLTGRANPVITPPVDTRFFRPETEPRGAFYLVVAETCTADDVQLAIQSCRLAERELTIVGQLPAAIAESLRTTDGLLCVGLQPDEALRYYYRRCRAAIVPGTDDIDATAIEAQACGAPVIAFRGGSAAETIIDAEGGGPGTGFFFDERTPAGVVAALQEFERRPHQCEPALLWANAAKYSVPQFGRAVNRLLDEIAAAETSRAPLTPQPRRAA